MHAVMLDVTRHAQPLDPIGVVVVGMVHLHLGSTAQQAWLRFQPTSCPHILSDCPSALASPLLIRERVRLAPVPLNEPFAVTAVGVFPSFSSISVARSD